MKLTLPTNLILIICLMCCSCSSLKYSHLFKQKISETEYTVINKKNYNANFPDSVQSVQSSSNIENIALITPRIPDNEEVEIYSSLSDEIDPSILKTNNDFQLDTFSEQEIPNTKGAILNEIKPFKNIADEPKLKVEPFGIAGFITGIVGLIVFGYIFGTIAIVFGAISLVRIRNNPDKYKGRGFAIASLILGIVGVALLTVLLLIA